MNIIHASVTLSGLADSVRNKNNFCGEGPALMV